MTENQNELLPCAQCGAHMLDVTIEDGYILWMRHPKNRCIWSEFEFDAPVAVEQWNTRATSPAERQAEDLQYALIRLILLKDHKDKHGKDTYYLAAQPRAWEYAKKVLKEDHPKHPAERVWFKRRGGDSASHECAGCGQRISGAREVNTNGKDKS